MNLLVSGKPTDLPKETKRNRLKRASLHNNRGTWFLAHSRLAAVDVEKRFLDEAVSSILYERIGGILQGPTPYLYVQIALLKDVIVGVDEFQEPIWKRVRSYDDDKKWPSWDVEVSLKDVGIQVLKPCRVRDIFHSGMY